MKQEFVYHALALRDSPHRRVRRQAHAVTADATLAVKEYAAYVAMLSLAVFVALITFAYTANMTVKWLDAVVKPSFLAQSQSVVSQPSRLAMLPAAVQFKKSD